TPPDGRRAATAPPERPRRPWRRPRSPRAAPGPPPARPRRSARPAPARRSRQCSSCETSPIPAQLLEAEPEADLVGAADVVVRIAAKVDRRDGERRREAVEDVVHVGEQLEAATPPREVRGAAQAAVDEAREHDLVHAVA